MSILNPLPQKRFALSGIAIMILLLSIGLGTHLFRSSGHAAVQETTQPTLVRQGDKFIIPQGSALAFAVARATGNRKDSPHTLVSPAAVEADPARTVNILPPVAGRVVKLRVRLGDRCCKRPTARTYRIWRPRAGLC